MMKRLFTLLCALTLTLACAAEAKTVEAASPGGNLRLAVDVSDRITYGLWSGEDKILENCTLSLTLADRTLGEKPRLRSVKRSSADEVLERRNPTKNASVRNRYNAVRLNFAGGYAVEFRLFDDGAAYRFVTSLPGEVEVMGEACRLGFPAGSEAWLSEVDGFRSMYEEPYTRVATAEYDSADRMSYLPVLVGMPGGKKVLLAESDVRDYPCMFVRGDGAGGFESLFPRVPKEYAPAGDRSLKIVAEEPYIARTQGTRTFPWRVAVVAEKDAALIENELVWLLAEPAADADWDWVKPGLVSWDWWNGMRLTGVDFRAGRNTESYRYYIDFAARYGIPYIIMDEGWSASTTDVFHPNPDLDLQELIAYGRERNVQIVLWLTWLAVEKDMDRLFATLEEWGIPGVKIDFMDRSDQWMVGYYERVMKCAARHRLFVDMHGSYTPKGLYQPAYLRGGARHGAGGPLQARKQQLAALYPQCRRTDGLHARLDVLGAARRQPFDGGQSDGDGDARLSDGAVRGFRKPAADARRQSGALPPRASLHGVSGRGSHHVGQPARPARRMRPGGRRGAPQGRQVVCRRHYERPALYDRNSARLPACGPYLYDDFVRGRGECRPAGHGLQKTGARGGRFDRREGGDGSQRRLGGRDRVAGRDFSTLSCTWSYGGCGALAPCPETWIMKKEMLFGISFYFAACARSAAIRFAGVRCRGRILRRLADDAGAYRIRPHCVAAVAV